MLKGLALLAVLAVVSVACSSTDESFNLPPSETAATTPPHEVVTTTTTQATATAPNLGTSSVVEWEFNGTVIDDGQPVLCAGDVMTSLPPQCVGVPVIGLDWSAVDWVETAGGVRWATMRLAGTFDGERFELTRPPEPPVVGDETPFSVPLPCEEPNGGWQIINAATADNDSPAVVYAQAQPEFMGNWVYRLPVDAAVYSVKVFTFTGNLAEHEARLREIYGGALCVSLAHRSLAELEAIRSRVKEVIVSPEAEDAGIYLANGEFGDTIDVISGTIEFYVFAAEAGAQGWLEWQFGEGVVNLHSLLQRLGQPQGMGES
ncbi:MAG: hypothetical protein V3U50_05290 [Acidimicrobiia bacterium]